MMCRVEVRFSDVAGADGNVSTSDLFTSHFYLMKYSIPFLLWTKVCFWKPPGEGDRNSPSVPLTSGARGQVN